MDEKKRRAWELDFAFIENFERYLTG